MTPTDPEYEAVGLTLRQRIALWRIIIKAWVKRVLCRCSP